MRRILSGLSIRDHIHRAAAKDLLQVFEGGQTRNRTPEHKASTKEDQQKEQSIMMLLTRKKQNEVYKRLVNITVELMRHKDEIEAQDTLDSVYEIGYLVGGMEMLKAMEGKK